MTRLHVATRKGLFPVVRDAMRRWRIDAPAFLGDPVSMILPDPRDGRLYAALDLGHFGAKLHVSPDQGKSWQEIACPAFPAKPAAAEIGWEDRTAWSVKKIWALEAGGEEEPGALWAGAIPAGLFRSADGGASWELVRALWDRPEREHWFGGGYDDPGLHSICVHPRDPQHLQVAISCGGVWTSRDGGAGWECTARGMRAEYVPPEQAGQESIQDPHLMVQCRAQPEHLWVQHHNGIFRSGDGGATWEEVHDVLPSAFGFAVAVHPEDPQSAWFVPAVKDECRVPVGARLVVNRTRDGGASFESLGRGLPQETAYDLVYRHALAIDPRGECLAMGSTTGGLWISEDQGDTWLCLSTHLPPIYALRFGA